PTPSRHPPPPAAPAPPARPPPQPPAPPPPCPTPLGPSAVFPPIPLPALAGEPRHYAQLTGIPGPSGALSPTGTLLAHTLPLNRFITYAAIFLATAQLLFFFNLFQSLRKGPFAASNPWQATTLEWHPALNPFSPLP